MSNAKAANKILNAVKKLSKRWFIDAFSGMAQGLFVTLIAGTILAMVAGWLGKSPFATMVATVANFAKSLMGAGIGVGIAHALKTNKLVMFSAGVMGMIGAFSDSIIAGSAVAIALGAPGNPIGAYVVALFTVEIASLYAGKTKLDIILVPIGMLVLALAGIYLAWPFIELINLFAKLLVILINAGEAIKFITGILVAVVMGVLLTMPTSSAAIWIAIARSPVALENPAVFAIAGGAAVAGCAAHMVGFAVTSYRENGVGGLIAQGIGTSMLQIPNIMKKPVIMLPEIVSSALAGAVAVLLDMRCTDVGGGMGTSGLVGLFGVIDSCTLYSIPVVNCVLGIVLCLFVIPAGVSLAVSEWLRHKNIIKSGDLKLDL